MTKRLLNLINWKGSQRLSGKYDGIVDRGDWNTDNSQDGDNASVSIVSPDATDNKELVLDGIQ